MHAKGCAGMVRCGVVGTERGQDATSEVTPAADNWFMTTSIAIRCASVVLVGALAAALQGCEKGPNLQWHEVKLKDAGLLASFPCEPVVAQRKVDFGVVQGPVTVHMMGCDAIDATYAVSHWLLDDARDADDALAFWEAAVMTKLNAVDSPEGKSGAPFVPAGAMNLPRSIRATVQGVGPSGWSITTHGVWFAKKEGRKARIYHAVIYAPVAQHKVASQFFQGLALREE